MKAAFIVMSILGCDDSGAQCTPVAQVQEQFQTIAACDAASEKHLSRYTNVNRPMVVAVCQTANTNALADSAEDAPAEVETASRSLSSVPQPPQTNEQQRGITARAIQLMKDVIPSKKGVTDTVIYPVHVVTDTYSWVARKITN